MNRNEKWLQWAIELQSLAQAGLTYGKDIYDRERYERVKLRNKQGLTKRRHKLIHPLQSYQQ